MVKLQKAKHKGRKIHDGTGRKDTGRTDDYSNETPEKDYADYRGKHPKVPRVKRSKRKIKK